VPSLALKPGLLSNYLLAGTCRDLQGPAGTCRGKQQKNSCLTLPLKGTLLSRKKVQGK